MSSYYQSSQNYFWDWEEKGEVLCLSQGYTLAYRSHLIEILETLQPAGLPNFTVLVSILAALSSHPEEGIKQMRTFASKVGTNNTSWNTDIWDVIQQIPLEYRKGKNKLILLYTLFENSHNRISASRSKAIINLLKSSVFLQSKELQEKDRNQDFRLIEMLSRKFPTVECILEQTVRIESLFIETLNTHLEKEENDGESASDNLTEALIENPATFHVGALIRRIQAGLKISYRNSHSGIQALGGFSDITNKGNIDRMLISEFAHTDLIFLSRWVNNETLYMNREVPPDDTLKERIILIDISLYNWGTPKVLAYSTMLAIINHPKSKYTCRAFTIGNSCTPIATDSPSQIANSLQILDAGLHAAGGLEHFFRENKYSDKEIILITSKKAESMPEMQKVINTYYSALNYRIYTDSQGILSSYRITKNGKLHIQDLCFDLKNIWKDERKIKSDTDLSSQNLYKPIIPINFHLEFNDVYQTNMGNFFGKRKGKLFMKADKGTGGWLLIDEKINGTLLAVGVLKNRTYICLMHLEGKRFALKDISTQRTIEFETPNRINLEQYILFRGDRFYINYGWKAWFTVAITGEQQILTDSDLPVTGLNHTKKLPTSPLSYINKIKKIGISLDGKLMMNSHYLTPSLEWRQAINMTIEKLAIYREDSKNFQFSEGTSITSYGGVLKIRSSNVNLPNIYIPTAIMRPLGVSTDNEFVGNTAFLPDPLVKIKFAKEIPPDQLAELLYAKKEMMNDFAKKEIWHLSETNAEGMSMNWDLMSIERENSELKIVNNDQFYQKYIQPLIDQI